MAQHGMEQGRKSILYPWIQGEALGAGLAHWGIPAAADLLLLLATHRQQQPLGRRGRRDEQDAFLACPHESTLTALQETQSLQQSSLFILVFYGFFPYPGGWRVFYHPPQVPHSP